MAGISQPCCKKMENVHREAKQRQLTLSSLPPNIPHITSNRFISHRKAPLEMIPLWAGEMEP